MIHFAGREKGGSSPRPTWVVMQDLTLLGMKATCASVCAFFDNFNFILNSQFFDMFNTSWKEDFLSNYPITSCMYLLTGLHSVWVWPATWLLLTQHNWWGLKCVWHISNSAFEGYKSYLKWKLEAVCFLYLRDSFMFGSSSYNSFTITEQVIVKQVQVEVMSSQL